MADSSIEWTDKTWNPVRGCDPVSPGCANCYAATVAARFSGPGQPYEGLAIRKPGQPAKWTGKIACVEDKLYEPATWRKPSKVFVNSMSDLFHEGVPDAFIRRVFGVMSLCGQHTFQVLTKRADRMAAWFADPANTLDACQAEETAHRPDPDPMTTPTGKDRLRDSRAINGTYGPNVGEGNYWPLPNVWLGTSVENQAAADERIPHLVRTPAAVRFLSCEPLLGEVDLSRWLPILADPPHRPWVNEPWLCPEDHPPLHWVIVGGESGHGARPMHPAWAASLRDQCVAADVPYFFKQWGEWAPQWVGSDTGPQRIIDRQGRDVTDMPGLWDNESDAIVRRVGKQVAGRLINGREWGEFPAAGVRA